jgi:hypothetical protein
MDEPYYFSYENRYKKVFSSGVNRWGHSPKDPVLMSFLSKWAEDNNLIGKRIIEFGCGEGAGGEILSKLGCIYHGVDISPSVIEKTKNTLKQYPNATVSLFDMVNNNVDEKYDGAIDLMALHMLILDSDRKKYLNNVFNCLNENAAVLFFRELYNENSIKETISSMEQWIKITGNDYVTPKIKHIHQNGMEIEINIPYVPGRERCKNGYIQEMIEANFIVEKFIEMEPSDQVKNSVSIFVRKPKNG